MDTQASGNPYWDQQQSQPQQQQSTSGNPYWDTPQDVTNAEQKVGDQSDNGYCETFVEQMTGSPNMGGSAAEAWNNYTQQGKAVQGLQGAKPGDKLYFYSPHQPNGHAAILVDTNGKMISNEGNGVVFDNINDFVKNTNQPLLGYIPQ